MKQINNPYFVSDNIPFNKLGAQRDYKSIINQDPSGLDDLRRESQMIKSNIQGIVHNDDVKLKYVDQQDGNGRTKSRRSVQERRMKNKSMVLGKNKTIKESYADALLDIAAIDNPHRPKTKGGLKTPQVGGIFSPID